jgi:hypothetical protein
LFTVTAAAAVLLAASRACSNFNLTAAAMLVAFYAAIGLPQLAVILFSLRDRPAYLGWLATLAVGALWGGGLFAWLYDLFFLFDVELAVFAFPFSAALVIGAGLASLRRSGWSLRTRKDDAGF